MEWFKPKCVTRSQIARKPQRWDELKGDVILGPCMANIIIIIINIISVCLLLIGIVCNCFVFLGLRITTTHVVAHSLYFPFLGSE